MEGIVAGLALPFGLAPVRSGVGRLCSGDPLVTDGGGRLLYAEHVGSQVTQHHGAVGPWVLAGQIDDLDSLQRQYRCLLDSSYFPLNLGVRFSTKAFGPSMASSVERVMR